MSLGLRGHIKRRIWRQKVFYYLILTPNCSAFKINCIYCVMKSVPFALMICSSFTLWPYILPLQNWSKPITYLGLRLLFVSLICEEREPQSMRNCYVKFTKKPKTQIKTSLLLDDLLAIMMFCFRRKLH